MYTHCPNCDAHFEITQEYLDIAQGKVRCGQCDHVFNALDNLYNKESAPVVESEDKLTQLQKQLINNVSTTTAHETSVTNKAQDSSGAQFNEVNPSIASIDIKEKMERIVASLSAATQELKNARKSTSFIKLPKDNIHSVSIEPENTIKKLETNPAIQDDKAFDTDITPQSDKPLVDADITPQSDGPLVDADIASQSDELLVDADITPQSDEASVDADITSQSDEASVDADITSQSDELLVDADITPQSDELLADAEDNELELVNYIPEEPDSTSEVHNFSAYKVDPGDIDVLNSLMAPTDNANSDKVSSDKNSSDNALLDELDNINKTLSDEDLSLDDEYSDLDDNFDQLDNGDDLLAELEQLESDFLNKKQISESQISTNTSSLDDTYEPEEGFDTQDNSENTDHFSNDKQSELNHHQEEEAVPSFLTQTASSSSSTSLFGWLAGTIVLLAVLFSQYLHFNSIKFAQNPEFRPLLESLCPITGCSLPLRKTPKKIITVTHDIHTHPTVNNALKIQLTFKNKAPYTQSYPILEITFSNSIGEVIARRKFSPDEYLIADIQYKQGLTNNQSQEINLNVVDPAPGSLLSFQFNYL